jgi:hypothetical protein
VLGKQIQAGFRLIGPMTRFSAEDDEALVHSSTEIGRQTAFTGKKCTA